MNNRMKNTVCRICGKDLNNFTFDQMEHHVLKHREERKGLKGIDDYA